MASADGLEAVAKQLATATSFVSVFGRLPSGSHEVQTAAIKRHHRFLVRQIHPDLLPTDLSQRAGAVFVHLENLYEAAEAAIKKGVYERASFAPCYYERNGHPAAISPVVLQSPAATYHLATDPTWIGDFSYLYQATVVGSDQRVIVKIAADPTVNSRLEWEGRVLSRFHNPKAAGKLARLQPFVPKLIDTFLVSGERGQRFRANVLPYRAGMVSITEILAAYPGGLDPRDAAWIARRVISQTLAATMVGVVHGAIVPDHVLVEPILHEPLHIGWLHAVDNPHQSGKRITMVIDRWREFYPPEVLRKQPPDHRTDLYMAAKTLIQLFGGDTARNMFPGAVPDPIARVIRQCVESDPARRPNDGRAVLDEFTRAIREAWGRAYRPLVMPVRS
ncbi:MAG: hypothetical protein HY340_03395 [Candidatus Kerfeldbacteria bacterium]|nr:hypothetical protein [Candidatus Kerfeldbacteria bacterium]